MDTYMAKDGTNRTSLNLLMRKSALTATATIIANLLNQVISKLSPAHRTAILPMRAQQTSRSPLAHKPKYSRCWRSKDTFMIVQTM